MATLETEPHDAEPDDGMRRRDVINIAALSFAGVGAVAAVAPMLVQMAPSADVLAMASIEVDISKILPGQAIKTSWRKQPILSIT
jgi:ubiquinol-cytochrome c reductase iron-sulfur subunit